MSAAESDIKWRAEDNVPRGTLRERIMESLGARAFLYKRLFEAPDGRAVLADLIRFTNWDQQSFVPNDPTQTAFNEGMRRVVTRIVKLSSMSRTDVERLARDIQAQQDARNETLEPFKTME